MCRRFVHIYIKVCRDLKSYHYQKASGTNRNNDSEPKRKSMITALSDLKFV